jgi:hypothetical protein
MNSAFIIAREVQERLFPQGSPSTGGLDCAGHCRPAQGVGGDYYDFVPLPDGRLGIAVGDVSGKGIPAALLMAGLRASLRGQTLGGPADLAALMCQCKFAALRGIGGQPLRYILLCAWPKKALRRGARFAWITARPTAISFRPGSALPTSPTSKAGPLLRGEVCR